MRNAIRLLSTVLLLALPITPAAAGGSIPLSDVMQQLEHDQRLISEIEAELEAQAIEADDVTCTGARFGSQWKELGGARAIPYECTIGTRELHIEGHLTLYDANDRVLDIDDPAAPEKAVRFTETELQWNWSNARTKT